MMENYTTYGHLSTVCVIGHGSIGRGTVPMIQRHFTFEKIVIIDPSPEYLPETNDRVSFIKIGLTPENYKDILEPIFVGKDCFCVNLSVGTSSADIMLYCQSKGVLYIDTVKEEWEGFYANKQIDIAKRSNYGLRESLLKKVRKQNLEPTAVSCCGANPGMVSWFVKQALINLAKDTGYPVEIIPKTKAEWATLMMNLGVKGVHIAQRDTQVASSRKPEGEFWNTWSVDGFISEGYYQPSELGWGTHEKWMPANGHKHREGCKSSIYMTKPGMNVQVKSWCPTFGPQYGFLVTHDESISISDYFTVREGEDVIFRPTCHYAYHPCQDAVISSLECIGSGIVTDKWKIMEKQVVSGIDELGVLLFGHQKNAYWYGSQLSIEDTRQRVQNQNATALQVCSAVIAGMVWAVENPKSGLVEADEMDFSRCLEVQKPYIEPVRGYYTDWNPLKNLSNELVTDNFDFDDPWQFKNILINK